MSNGGTKPSSSSSTFHLVAGLGSGFTSAVLLQPADLLKTRVQQERQHAQQLHQQQQQSLSPSSSSVRQRLPRTPHALLNTLRTIASEPHPLRQLWRGTLPSTIRTSFGSALYFSALNKLRTALSTHHHPPTSSSSTLPQLPAHLNLLAGAVARASVGFVTMPITVLKVRYESSLFASYSTRLGLWGSARALYAAEGLRGFFAGAGATAVRDAPYAGLYVVFYEGGKKFASGGGGGSATPLFGPATTNFLCAAGAACAATLATNPPDAVKTRLQLQPGKYRNSVHAVRLMLAQEGPRSLFDGLGLRMARKGLSSALAWTVYEEVVRRAEGRWVRAFGGG